MSDELQLFQQDHAAELLDLAARHGVPPFSTINARGRDWINLKRKWRALGMKSELGRDLELIPTGKNSVYGGTSSFDKKRVGRGTIGRGQNMMARDSWVNAPFKGPKERDENEDEHNMSTSIFDPVLAQLAYEWWTPPGGWILDPFAGGSVRGIVASRLGRRYCGIDLRREQVEANDEQAGIADPAYPPHWIQGNSLDLMQVLGDCPEKRPADGRFDFIFSCPPYFDLEVYSDDPADLSNLSWQEFCRQYEKIVANCSALLKDNRFAAFVVGEVRDKRTGIYRGFVPETIHAFQRAGLGFYNEIIVETSIASAPLRTRMFTASRKVVKVHQNLLVFVKGDWRAACAALPEKVGLLMTSDQWAAAQSAAGDYEEVPDDDL